MNITHHLNTIIKNTIKDKVLSDRKVPDTDGDIVASRPHLRVASERFAYSIEIIKKPVRRGSVVAGDIEPDVDQILLGLCGAP
jgi:hypothetical protein